MKVQYYTLSRHSRKTLEPDTFHRMPHEQTNWPFSAWLLRPYLNLTPYEQGPIHSRGIDAAYRQLTDIEMTVLPLQSHPSCVLRQTIIRENDLDQFTVQHPRELPDQLRTDRWQYLVECIEAYPDLCPEQQIRLVTLLARLGFYHLIIDLIPPDINDRISQDTYSARMAAKRCIAVHKLTPGKQIYVDILREIALSAPGDHHVRLLAATALIVFFGRKRSDIEDIRYWVKIAENEYWCLEPGTDWRDSVYASMYWRAVAFEPFNSGDRQATAEYLDQAEHYAYAVSANSEIQKIVRDENIHPLLETRRKEALWLRNLDLAYERARALVEHDPFDPKVHIQMGDVLLTRDDPIQALKAYRQAVFLGTPYTPFAWFMIGYCEEALGNLEEACYAYQSALRIDPWGITPAQRLIKVARRLNQPVLAQWAENILETVGIRYKLTRNVK